MRGQCKSLAKLAGTLLPDGDRYSGEQYFASTKTRAQVNQESRDAITHGDIAQGENYPRFVEPVSGKMRAQVQQELAQSRRIHNLVNDELVANQGCGRPAERASVAENSWSIYPLKKTGYHSLQTVPLRRGQASKEPRDETAPPAPPPSA